MQNQVQQKGLWGMSKPLLVEQALQFSIPLIDTIFLSIISDTAASATGAMLPILILCSQLTWVSTFAGASVASQRIGAQDYQQANATIFTYSFWALLLSLVLCTTLFQLTPWLTSIIGLTTQASIDANQYMGVASLLIVVWALKGVFQSILNIYGQPKWNMIANIVYFSANIVGNSIAVFGLFGFEKSGVTGVAWASVIASALGVTIACLAVIFQLKLRLRWQNMVRYFRNATKNIYGIALPAVIEPLAFNMQMIVLNSFAAKLGAAALAAKVYTFNTFFTCLIVSVALTTATEVIISQHVGAQRYQKVIEQMKQSLKVALWGTGIMATCLLLLASPIMSLYTDNEVLLAGAVWWFLLAALAEQPRTMNIMVGGILRATGDGWYISAIGTAYSWLIALPLAYVLTFTFELGIIGLLIAAIVDEGGRSLIYYNRWHQNRWQHSNVRAKELAQAN